MKQKVVVIGHGYTSRLGVIRALGREGYDVIVIVIAKYERDGKTLNTTRPIDCYSKYVTEVLYCPSNQEQLVNLLLTECIDERQKVVIIPDSDFSAAIIDKNQDLLRDFFLFPHINHEVGAVNAWMDKDKQKKLAKDIGLKVAEGWMIEVNDGLYKIPEGLRYPCFPKPVVTLVGGKSGLRRCDNESDLHQVMEELINRSSSISVLVEEYKRIETEQALLGLTDGKEVIIPGIIKTLSLANGYHFGVAKQGVIQPVTGYEELVEKFKKFVLKTGYVGIFDIDFYYSEGNYYFCEMNFRYGGSGYAYTKSGINLPAAFVAMIKGKQDLTMVNDGVISERIYVNERMLLDDLRVGNISIGDYNKAINSADIRFVPDDIDTEPEKWFKKIEFKAKIKHVINKVMRRQ